MRKVLAIWRLLYNKYIERRDFIQFIQYLFENDTHNFNVLPKICLALDRSKEINQLELNEMSIEYVYDMRNVDSAGLSPDSSISYIDTIKYNLKAENKNIPDDFILYRGNMKADQLLEIKQKHGSQNELDVVPPPRYTDETHPNTAVQRYSWQIRKENISKSPFFPLFFQFEYTEKAVANSSDTIIFYPKQYAKSIKSVDFNIKFLYDEKILKDVKAYKIWKDNNHFKHTPISGVELIDNTASIQIQPDTNIYEAYYLRLNWELV